MMFNTYIRENLVKGNILDYCDFIKKFTFPLEKEKSLWKVNTFPLIILNLQVNMNKKKKEKKKKKDEPLPNTSNLIH